MSNNDLLVRLFATGMQPKSIREMRLQSGLKQKEFDEVIKHLLNIGYIKVTRYEYDEVGDQIPAEYGPTEIALDD